MSNSTTKNNQVALVLDNHIMFTDSFSIALEQFKKFNVIHSFYEEKEFLNFMMNHKHKKSTTFLFIDYGLKDHNSLFVINEVRRLNKHINIIVLSDTINPIEIKNILSYSPQGFISKSSGINEIVECIETINNKQEYICPLIKEILDSSQESNKILFTARELDLLNYFVQGFSIAQTAEKTFLSRHTIVAHRRKMMEKTKTNSITGLLAHCRQLGIV